MSTAELEQAVEDMLEYYRNPGHSISHGRELSQSLLGRTAQTPEDDDQIVLALRDLLDAELSQLRSRLERMQRFGEQQTVEQQLRADLEAGHPRLERLSLLRAYYIDGLDKQQIADLYHVGKRRVEQKLEESLQEFARMIRLRATAPVELHLLNQPDQRRTQAESPPEPRATPTSAAQRIRNTLVRKVYDTWISGILEGSLHQQELVELYTADRPDAVRHPWDTLVQPSAQREAASDSAASIIDVFDRFSQELLILGEPGSGKTTALLILARDLLLHADRDSSAPIPVILNLASWRPRWPTFELWLIDELSMRYGAPPQFSQRWLQLDQLLPLLDGLDELPPEHRAQCVEAINSFRRRNGVSALVVCSRSADYLTLEAQLNLRGAIELQPLSLEQIDRYLVTLGPALAMLRQLVQTDPDVQELAHTPLLLHIMVLVYHGKPLEDVDLSGTQDEQRRRLFDAYIDQMLHRRGRTRRYTPAQTIRWLAWLAHAMVTHNQSIFLLEAMQPNWLPAGRLRQRYLRINGLFLGSMVGLMIALLAVSALVGGVPIVWPSLLAWLTPARISTLTLLTVVLSVLVYGSLAVSGASKQQNYPIAVVESLHWSASTVRFALICGLLLGSAVGLASGLVFGLGIGLLYGAAVGLMIGLLLFTRGLTGTDVEIERKIKPNQGIHRSALNALLLSCSVGLTSGIGVGLLAQIPLGERLGAAVGLRFGLGVGVVMLLFYGGHTCFMHLLLRAFLYRADLIPREYVRFLDYAAERILLRKLGGGYLFMHRLLLEHFAARYLPPDQSDSPHGTDAIG